MKLTLVKIAAISIKLLQDCALIILLYILNCSCLMIYIAFLYFYMGLQICMVGCFGLNSPVRQYFSPYRAVFQREGERKMID